MRRWLPLLLALLALPALAQGPLPDLEPVNIAFNPANPQPGDPVEITAHVRNKAAQSSTLAIGFNITYHVGPDLVDTKPVRFLPGGATGQYVSKPWNATAGSHRVRVVADAFQQVQEADENNNELQVTLAVVEPPPGARPDLVALGLAALPPAPEAHELVVFLASLRNEGNSTAGPSRARFLVDGAELGMADVPAVGANASAQVASPPWNATAGSHQVRVVLDAAGVVREGREDNNEAELGLRVEAPQADLVVEGLALDPPSPKPGDDAQVVGRVANRGRGAAPATRVDVLVDGALLGTVPVGPLAPGGSQDVRSPVWRVVAGEHEARMAADAGSQVAEAQEANNVAARRFTVGAGGTTLAPLPELTLARLDVDPLAPRAGERVVLVAQVVVEGAALARVQFVLDGAPLGIAEAAPGPDGIAVLRSRAFDATAGDHVARAVVDPEHAIAEREEGNNAREAPFRVLPAQGKPDLVVFRVSVPLSGPGPMTFEAEVRNRGEGAAPAARVAFEVDGVVVGRADLPPLPPGGSANVTSPTWGASPGDHQLRVAVDPEGAVDETEEGNNVATSAFTTRAPTPRDAPGAGALALLAGAGLAAALLRRRPR